MLRQRNKKTYGCEQSSRRGKPPESKVDTVWRKPSDLTANRSTRSPQIQRRSIQ
jgi:hypothetical protein